MPNWCENTLHVTGSNKDLTRFKKAVAIKTSDGKPDTKHTPLSFENILPKPKKEKDWHNWNIKHWGTKWDANSSHLEVNKGELIYVFYTAWSPPTPVVLEASRQYPSLNFRLIFSEEGCAFFGEEEYENGELTNSKEYSEEEYLELYNEVYNEEKETLASMGYDKLLEGMVNRTLQINYYPNERVALKRIKDEDLPLLVGYEWYNHECETMLEKRMKGDLYAEVGKDTASKCV